MTILKLFVALPKIVCIIDLYFKQGWRPRGGHSGAKHQKSEHYSRPFLRLQECTLNLSEDLQNRNLSRYLDIQKIYVSKISPPPSEPCHEGPQGGHN